MGKIRSPTQTTQIIVLSIISVSFVVSLLVYFISIMSAFVAHWCLQ